MCFYVEQKVKNAFVLLLSYLLFDGTYVNSKILPHKKDTNLHVGTQKCNPNKTICHYKFNNIERSIEPAGFLDKIGDE